MNFKDWYEKEKISEISEVTDLIKNNLWEIYEVERWYSGLGESIHYSEIVEAAGCCLSEFTNENRLVIRQVAGACFLYGYFTEINKKGKIQYIPSKKGVGRGLNNLWTKYPERIKEIEAAFCAAIDAGLNTEWLLNTKKSKGDEWKVKLKKLAADKAAEKSAVYKDNDTQRGDIPSDAKIEAAIETICQRDGTEEVSADVLRVYFEQQAQETGRRLHPDWLSILKERSQR